MLFKDPVFQSFVSKRPIAVMAHLALSRLLDANVVDRIFHETSERQYHRKLLFSSITDVLSAVVMSKHASVNAAYKKMKEKVGVSLNGLYQKIDRVEPAISQALVRHSYQQVLAIRKDLGGNPRHEVSGYRTRIFDGNHLSGTEHRLSETRNTTAAPLPGKSLVVLDPRHQAIVDYFPIEDGHAQERSALDPLLATVEAFDLWIGDRNFCTLKPIFHINAMKAAFVIRHHKKLEGHSLGKRHKVGKSETGMVYERTMVVTYQGQKLTLRRIEVELKEPTRDGDTTLVILTNLPVESADAIKIAELYRTRWKIETAFQTLTVSMNCEIKTLCYPKAALLTFALALVAYNAQAMVKAAIACQHGREAASQMSHHYMALEIAETTDGMLVALELDRWLDVVKLPVTQFNQQMCTVAEAIDLAVYRKAVRGPKKKKTKRKHNKRVVHVSSAKLIAARKQ